MANHAAVGEIAMSINRFWTLTSCFGLAAVTVTSLAIAGAVPPAEEKQAATKSLFAPSPQKVIATEPKEAAVPAENAAPAKEAIKHVKLIQFDFTTIEDAEAKYDEFFQNNVASPKLVRARVRQLLVKAQQDEKSTKEFDHILALLQSAIRNGQVQSWMYEAMGLTMQFQERSKDDIERALMSAADFTDDPQAKLAMADYLSRMGYEKRAVDLYQQVGETHALHTDTFEKALNVSQYIKDGEAAEWASLGILRRAAQRNEMTLWKRAHRVAQSRLAELRANGEQKAADEFSAELADALRRDLLVIVRWNGDADVDMIVEEPGGTTCSLHNPRTAGGGVMTASLADTLSENADDEHSAMYVCPEGFAGKYRVMLRQVWGRIPSGKVTVDIFGNQGDNKVAHVRRQIALSDEPSLVAFDLPEGRRNESLKQHQLVNDIKTQLAVNQIAANRALLAQQINTVSGTSGTPSGPSTVSLDQDPRFIGRRPPNFGQRSAVGIRPVVSLLPEGITMSVNAVISADRKYVRITALPFFSQVGEVTEFNIGQVPEDDTDLVDVNEISVDDQGNIVDSQGCWLVDADGRVINEQPPCIGPPEPDPAVGGGADGM